MKRVAVILALSAAGCELAGEQCSIDQVCDGAAARFGVGGGPGHTALRDLDGDGAAEWITVSPALGTLAVTWGFSGPAQTWSLGQAPADLAIGDVDGDGRLDVAAPLADEGALALLRGAGPRQLGAVERVAVGPRPVAAAAADLDGDGRAEVIVADAETGDLRVVRVDAGGLTVDAPVADGEGPARLAVGDFSGDGRVDVAVTRALAGTAKLFLGTGDGGLVAGETIYAGAGPGRMLAADLDDDGALDLALVDALFDEVALVLGDGAGGARETRRWPVAAGPQSLALFDGPNGHELLVMSGLQRALTRLPLAGPEARTTTPADDWLEVAVGDLDGDGAAEVVVGESRGATALREAPGFGFVPWFERETSNLAGPLAARDLDGDGWLDLVVCDRERGEIALLRGQEGGFAEPVRSPGPQDAEGLALADLDGDGADDVVTWRSAGYLSVDKVRKGTLWSARRVGDRFEAPIEFEFEGDPRQVIAFDGDGDGRSELLARQVRMNGLAGGGDSGAGPGLLTLQLAEDAFALVDTAMSEEFALSGDVLAGDFSPDHAGDELIRVAGSAAGMMVLSESRSAGEGWLSGALPQGTRPYGLTRADFTGDGIADLLVCGADGLVLAAGEAWHSFAPGRLLADVRCQSAIVAELDGDGRADLITMAQAGGRPSVEVQLRHALPWLPRFTAGGTTTASNRPLALTLADFDRDGVPDLAASGVDGLQVLRGGPRPVLRADPETRQRAGLSGGLQLADVDGDGRVEVVGFGRGGDVGIGRFSGTGSLGPVLYDMSERARDLQDAPIEQHKLMLDADGDGADELLWALVWPERGIFFTELHRASGDRFVRAAGVPYEISPTGPLRAGDLDGDGDDDLVYVHRSDVLVTHAGGPEGLGPPQVGPSAGPSLEDLLLGDVDRDGRLDAIVSSWGDEVLVFLGDGRGGFVAAPQRWQMGRRLGALATGDFDDDGFGDLIAGVSSEEASQLRVCHGGPEGPRGECRHFDLGPGDAAPAALVVEDIDGDGVTDVLAVMTGDGGRRLLFGRGGDNRLVLHERPLPSGRYESVYSVQGELRRLQLDDEGAEWVYVDPWEVTRLGLRAR